MYREEIIKDILESGLLTTCVDYQLKKQPQHYANRDDIIQDAWLWLLSYDIQKLNDAYINKHLFSKTSEYYRKYVKFNNLSNDLKDAERKESDV